LQQIQQALIATGRSADQAITAAPGQIFQILKTQSAILAYSDVFIITACLCLMMVPAALMLSGVKAKPGAGAH
jgi:DHA2 family multidrug resistance protein